MAIPTITVDVGTTGIKLGLFDAQAELLTAAQSPTPTTTDSAGEIYDLPALLGVVTRFIKELPSAQRDLVQRIAITGVGESGGLVRPDLTLASPMVLWHDQRGAGHLASLTAEQRSLIYRVTGLPVSGNYGLSKVAWAIEQLRGTSHSRDIGQPVDVVCGAQWLNIAEYLAAVMTGQRWSEPSLASRTMALDLSTGTWSSEVCALLDVDTGVFPPLRPATDGVTVTHEFAAAVGIDTIVRVHVAGHDHMVGAVGAGLQPGELLNSTGTTEGLLFLRGAPSLDVRAEHAKLANGLACADSGPGADYTLFASIPTGGSAFATLRSILDIDAARLTGCLVDLHDRYLRDQLDLAAVPLVLPQFRGSPPPAKNTAARGIISGLSSQTSAAEIVFGCFLGLVLQFLEVLELFDLQPDRIKVIGPASRNPLWLQLKADLLGTPLAVSRFPEVVSRGAQALASGGADGADQWARTDPYEVAVDAARHARLTEWRADIGRQWAYLKGLPS